MRMDDAGEAIAVWQEAELLNDLSSDLRLRSSVRAPGPSGAFEATPHLLSDFGDWLDFAYSVGVGPTGATVASWPERGAGNYLTKAAFGYIPKPPPDPGSPPPPPLPPPPPDPPAPSAIQVARPLESGQASIFTLKVSGQVDRLEWDVNGAKMTGRVVNGRLQDSIRLRIGSGAVNVRVRAVGPGGSTNFSRAVAGPKEPRDDASKKVSRSIDGSVVAVGEGSVLGGKSKTCGPVTVASSIQELSGCFIPVDDLSDIPTGERGVLDALADAYHLGANDGALMSRAVELSDGYITPGTLVVNGIWPVMPSGSAKLVLFQQAEVLTSSNAAFKVGNNLIRPNTNGFRLRLPKRRDDIDLGVVRRPSSLTDLGGFKYTGDFKVKLGLSFATIETGLQFPNLVTRNGQPLTVKMAFYASPDAFSGLDNLTIGTFGVNFGPMPIHNFRGHLPAGDQLVGRPGVRLRAHRLVSQHGAAVRWPPVRGRRARLRERQHPVRRPRPAARPRRLPREHRLRIRPQSVAPVRVRAPRRRPVPEGRRQAGLRLPRAARRPIACRAMRSATRSRPTSTTRRSPAR